MAESSDRTRRINQPAPLHPFRGRTYPLNAVFSPLLDVLAVTPDDTEAHALLKNLLHEVPPAALVSPLLHGLTGLEIELHAPALEAVASIVAASPARLEFLALLTKRADALMRHLALALVAKLTLPLTGEQVTALYPVLGDRRVGRAVRIAAVAQLCRTTLRTAEAHGTATIQAFLTGAGRGRALRRLTRVREQVGPHPLLDRLIERLERRARMTCPRCQVELRRPRMVTHLWDEHRLLLEGRTVRDPWSLIDDWLQPHPTNVPPDVVERCQTLAGRIDPIQGPARLEQMLAARQPVAPLVPAPPAYDGIPEDASSCPQCGTMIPATPAIPVPNAMPGRGRVAAMGYEVEVASGGLRTRLLVRLGQSVLLDGAEPGQWLTANGAILAFAGPFVLLALACAVGLFDPAAQPLLPVALLLGLASAVGLLARWGWHRRAALADRTIDYAWTIVVPRLHGVDFSLRDSTFLCGLAHASLDRGQPAARALLLSTMTSRTQQALANNAGLAGHLAALRRLAIHDAVAEGRDPLPLIVEEVARCLEGRLPLVYAHFLLDDWPARWWTAGKKARLRVLLCDRAFEIGLEVGPLLALATAAPALGALLDARHPERLAQLRLLWSLRPLRPWDQIGTASSVYEMAPLPASEDVLGQCPDLLLMQEEADYKAAALHDEHELYPVQLLVCGRGVQLQGVLFKYTPLAIEIVRLGVLFRAGHQLTLDDQKFRFNGDPEPIVDALEQWCHYLWDEFMPQTGRAAGWQSPMVKRLLRPAGAGTCPRCQTALWLSPGQMAVEIPQIGTTAGA